jgi:peptidoglycan/xylan/chitin deacetylase (PgdA/CDA1 family)
MDMAASPKPRRTLFGKIFISMAASLLFSSGVAHLANLPSPAPHAGARATKPTTGAVAASPPTGARANSPALPPVGVAAPRLPTGRDAVRTQKRIEHCQTSGPQVWLTFDDGGSAQQVDRILAVLRHEHVQAIFFPIGSWAESNPRLVRRIGRAGHLVGDHTQDHVDLAKASDKKAASEIQQGKTHTAGSVPLLRPPFGAGAYTARLDSLATSAGLRLCTWTVDTRDWTGSSAARIVRRVRHGDAMTPPVRAGGVIIMHMNGEHTGRALPGVIHAVRARGLRLHALPR